MSGNGLRNPPLKGVRDPRITKQSFQNIENPRPDANRDIIALERRWLRDPNRASADPPSSVYRNYLKQRPSIPPAADNGGTPNSEPPESRERPSDREADLTLVQYRYTKALEVVNDEMGYGERVTEIFWQATADDSMRVIERKNQRTKSGRQVLELNSVPKASRGTSGNTAGE